jgi:hypothetical protein
LVGGRGKVTATVKLNLTSGGQLDEGKFGQRFDKMDKHRDQKVYEL